MRYTWRTNYGSLFFQEYSHRCDIFEIYLNWPDPGQYNFISTSTRTWFVSRRFFPTRWSATHYAAPDRSYLAEVFWNRCMVRRGLVEWPARPPDHTTWRGYLKYKVDSTTLFLWIPHSKLSKIDLMVWYSWSNNPRASFSKGTFTCVTHLEFLQNDLIPALITLYQHPQGHAVSQNDSFSNQFECHLTTLPQYK